MIQSNLIVQNLLFDMKSIVQLVIRSHGDCLISQYGAIERVRSSILAILSHGLKHSSTDIFIQCWRMIVNLNKHTDKYLQLLQDVYQRENVQLSVEQWIDQSILRHCLVEQFPMENDSFEQFYESDAFMRRSTFYHAFLICIRTIETSDASLLLQIDPSISRPKIDLHSNSEQMSHSFHRLVNSEPVLPRDSIDHQRTRTSITHQTTFIDEEVDDPSIKMANLPYSSLLWPKKDQTLEEYLHQHDSQTRTNMEKENTHFYLSEVMLATIEYVKFSQPTSIGSLPSTYPAVTDDLSAESIALALIERWKTCQLPNALDLFQMVANEKDLIIESSLTNSEDRSLKTIHQSALRGDNQWAPPRPQLILHVHQPISREKQLKKQTYRCAGCGMLVDKHSADRFRYCEYTGKYFCYNCHQDQKFYLPSYIITKWEFSNKHSVSNFAYNYLVELFPQANFDIYHLNSKLFERSGKLKKVNELRWSLHFLQSYIFTCRMAEENGVQEFLCSIPMHIYESPHTYSFEDLLQTKLGELRRQLEPVVNRLRDHVLQCDLCRGKGFICELCGKKDEILYSFDLKTTSLCRECQSCFHQRCHQKNNYICPKCQRTQLRKSNSANVNDD